MSYTHSSAVNIELQDGLSADLERKELYFNHTLSTVALFGLVVLPLIPGSLSFASIVAHFPDLLGIPTWLAYCIAIFTAVGVEVLGLVVIKLALRMRKFNQRAADLVAAAPLGQGVAAAALYLGVVLALVVLLKVMPAMAIWALIPLACLGAIADWAFALQGDQSEREAELRKLLVRQEAERNQQSEIERLSALLAAQALDLQTTQERLQYAKDLNAEVSRQFDTERQTLNTEIVKLTAKLDAIKSATVYPSSSTIPVVNNDTTTVLDSGRIKAIDAKRNAKAQRQHDLLHILLTEFNGQASDMLNKSALGERLGATRQTIGKDIEELIATQRVSINGHIQVL